VLSAVVLLPEAVADVADGFGWYEDQELGLGEEFLRCLDRAYALIAAHPLHYPIRFDSFRRILVRRFPYAVYFEHNEQTVFVHYVFHCAQDPEKLVGRLRPLSGSGEPGNRQEAREDEAEP
jgi:plasmid stabilization system protein ParE